MSNFYNGLEIRGSDTLSIEKRNKILSIVNQRLPDGLKLYFDPPSASRTTVCSHPQQNQIIISLCVSENYSIEKLVEIALSAIKEQKPLFEELTANPMLFEEATKIILQYNSKH